MIAELFVKARTLFLSEREDAVNISQIRHHLEHFGEQTSSAEALEQLDELCIAYLLRHLAKQCHEDIRCPSELQDLKSPGYRASVIKHLPSSISRLLSCSRLSKSNYLTSQYLRIPAQVRDEAIAIANQSPFAHKHQQVLCVFSDLEKKLENEDFYAVVCAAILKVHCLGSKPQKSDEQLFNHGINCAYINMLLAEQYHFEPIRNFLAGMIQYISLIYINRYCLNLSQLPARDLLLQDVTQILPRLSYWIAKDWGLPDDVQSCLKERYQPHDDMHKSAQLLQHSDHAAMAISLHQDKLLSQRQAENFLKAMGLERLSLIKSLSALTH